MPFNNIRGVFHPEIYHGFGKKQNFFEGWYFKIVNQPENLRFAIIPGIAMGNNKDEQHAFIQILDGTNCISTYYRFKTTEFWANNKKFEITIADNYFSADKMSLNLPNFKGTLQFSSLTPWPKTLLSPGIMGWYSFVPFMECYHGVVSLYHTISGSLTIDETNHNFNNGIGYTEKDWGTSFPSAWIWMQTNHFSQSDICLTASVAKIPWLGGSFIGFIAGLWLKNKLHVFTTYTGAKLQHVSIQQNTIHYKIADAHLALELIATQAPGAELKSPVLGLMEGRIKESMQATVTVKLFEKSKQNEKLIFSDTARNAGLEVAGNVQELLIS
ncbi:hypothetical protein C7N43_30175 [Sphingobacteriales bacterium UPWRP_1]|nr:hypothetical protein BVG80_18655 [Sphingobacteriales bacterium TSM_CSM]PSJ73242.1 hypothetical protein C7N43_30175 [Sphingobacteriales bacterium UPWRP_1]